MATAAHTASGTVSSSRSFERGQRTIRALRDCAGSGIVGFLAYKITGNGATGCMIAIGALAVLQMVALGWGNRFGSAVQRPARR